MVIYKITNLIDGKIYVGKTIGSVEARFNRHMRLSSKCPKLSAAVQKHGRQNFKVEIIEICKNIDDLNKQEIFWINKLDSINAGYNLTFGGEGGIPSNETKEKLRKYRTGKKHSLATLKQMSDSRKLSNNANSKIVVVLKDSQSFTFNSLKEAAIHFKVSYSAARTIAQGINKKTRNGLIFKYQEEK